MSNDTIVISNFFRVAGPTATFEPAGIVSLEQAAQYIRTAIEWARDKGANRLLVDALQLTGFPSPSVPERFWIVRSWAQAAQGKVAVAMVLPRYLIDPDRFGIIVAVNMGMRADVFSERAPAEEWLSSERASSVIDLASKQGESPHEGSSRLC